MEIIHHGARDGVTGSCHQLRMDDQHSLLIDCGLFQGAEVSAGTAGADRLTIDFDITRIRALIATHVHIDHVGRIPYLLAAGFKGPILCSEPSAKLLPIVLEDAFKLGISRDQHKVECYLALIQQRIIALPYNRWFSLQDSPELSARVRLQRAGHIIGSAYVEVDLHYPERGERKRVLFSGDLGAPYAPLLRAPKPPYGADLVVLESTYGDRNHDDRRQRRQRLKKMIRHGGRNMQERIAHGHSLRKGRVSEVGRIYLVTTVVRNRRPIFLDWQLGRLLVSVMRQAEQQGRVDSCAWVIMPDHLRWLFRLTDGTLDGLMRDIKSHSGRQINRAGGLGASFWQAGYHDRAVRHDEDLKAIARYVVANPLRAGLAARMGEYPLWDAAWL